MSVPTGDITLATIVIAVIVLLAIGIPLAFIFRRRARTRKLRERFGPEYDYVVETAGSRREAEAELEARVEHAKEVEVHPLSPEQRSNFAKTWRSIQAEFVDEPGEAVQEASRLISRVMNARGYPINGFEQNAASLSIDYPEVVTGYRQAYQIALNHQEHRAGTEQLRQAMVCYREVLEKLADMDQDELLSQRVQGVGNDERRV